MIRVELLVLSLLTVLSVVMGDTIGYLGESVTLSSGANPSWHITKITWSIYNNDTWIATFRSRNSNTEWLGKFKSRLSLNTSSGDLEIRDVQRGDELVYSVLLTHSQGEQQISKVPLTVTERLVEPSVQKVFSVLKDGHCVMALRCSSSVKDTRFSWEPEASFDGSFWRGSPNANVSVVWASYSPNRNVIFICTASNGLTNASKVVREICQDEQPKPDMVVEGENRVPGIIKLLLGFLFGCLLTYIFRESLTCLSIRFNKSRSINKLCPTLSGVEKNSSLPIERS
ncbi:CD48 antigen-like [Oncorhynchus clarkii lewisi]|uniref:CD48 antigen-like n=1 Tax=Oncorhynchus clarkii lewisi TaxID=490388 RepID=UPI0039B8DF13